MLAPRAVDKDLLQVLSWLTDNPVFVFTPSFLWVVKTKTRQFIESRSFLWLKFWWSPHMLTWPCWFWDCSMVCRGRECGVWGACWDSNLECPSQAHSESLGPSATATVRGCRTFMTMGRVLQKQVTRESLWQWAPTMVPGSHSASGLLWPAQSQHCGLSHLTETLWNLEPR